VNNEHQKQDLDAILGKGSGEYEEGAYIHFTENGVKGAGTIIHVTPPHTTPTGRHMPLSYLVDTGEGFPKTILQSEIDM